MSNCHEMLDRFFSYLVLALLAAYTVLRFQNIGEGAFDQGGTYSPHVLFLVAAACCVYLFLVARWKKTPK